MKNMLLGLAAGVSAFGLFYSGAGLEGGAIGCIQALLLFAVCGPVLVKALRGLGVME